MRGVAAVKQWPGSTAGFTVEASYLFSAVMTARQVSI